MFCQDCPYDYILLLPSMSPSWVLLSTLWVETIIYMVTVLSIVHLVMPLFCLSTVMCIYLVHIFTTICHRVLACILSSKTLNLQIF